MILRIYMLVLLVMWASDLLSSASDEVICFSTEFEARMGNLMFQYAATVGLCAKHNRTLEQCSQLIMPRFNDPDTPVPEFVATFTIPKGKIEGCVIDKHYHEHAESKEAIMFDEALMNVSSGTMLHGYLQSYKYFHPHAETVIRKLYSFSEDIQNQSSVFIQSIRNQLPHIAENRTNHLHHEMLHHGHVNSSHTLGHPNHSSSTSGGYKVVGVHVRLGDKLNNPFYNSWSLSHHYYSKAIELVQAQHPHTAFVFFTGGSNNRADFERDVEWTKKNLAANISHSFHEDSNNHLVALHSLSLCDIIITAHSSYSWWAGYLSHSPYVIAPRHMFPHRLPLFVFEDYYLPHWQLLSEHPDEDRIFGINPFGGNSSNIGSSTGSGAVVGSTVAGSSHRNRFLRVNENKKVRSSSL